MKNRSQYPISCSLDLLGDKWSLLFIRDILRLKECTYSDFLKFEEQIATKILASRLLMLEENSLIRKLEHPESKAKVLYRLTKKGIDLLPLLIEMQLWLAKYHSVTNEQKDLIKGIKKDKESFIKAQKKILLEFSGV